MSSPQTQTAPLGNGVSARLPNCPSSAGICAPCDGDRPVIVAAAAAAASSVEAALNEAASLNSAVRYTSDSHAFTTITAPTSTQITSATVFESAATTVSTTTTNNLSPPTPARLYPGAFPSSTQSSPLYPPAPYLSHQAILDDTANLEPESYNHLDHYSLTDDRKKLPPSPPSLKSPKSFAKSRKQRGVTAEDVPRQTLLKALASRRPSLSLPPMSIATNLRQSIMSANATHSPRYIHSPPASGDASLFSSNTFQNHQLPSPAHENDGLNEYAIEASSAAAARTPAKTPRTGLAPMQSPCFYHQRFDNAVNVERVLEEIAGDEYQSHSRLMQTALGVREVARQLQRRTCKMTIKNVMIVTKARDNQLVMLTRELAHWLMKTPRYGSRTGVNVYVDKKLRGSKRFNAESLVAEDPEFANQLKYWTPDLCWTSPESFDLVLTLGGDGTVLFTSWLFQRVVPPVLSFSLGSLGFLTNFKFDLYREILDKVLDDGMRVFRHRVGDAGVAECKFLAP